MRGWTLAALMPTWLSVVIVALWIVVALVRGGWQRAFALTVAVGLLMVVGVTALLTVGTT